MKTASDAQNSLPTWFLTMIAMAVLVAVLWFGRGFLIPLAITGLLFILASALVDKFKRIRVFGRLIPGWLAHLLSASTVIGLLIVFGFVVSSSKEEVQQAIPEYQERLSNIADQVEAVLGPKLIQSARDAVANADIGDLAATAASGFAGAISTFGLVALYLAFLMSERMAWLEKLPRLVASEAGAQRAQKITSRISDGVKQYMWVNAVTSAMSGIVAFIIFSWIDLDFASLLAVTVFAAGFIPNIGAFIGIALPSLVALIQFDSLTPFLIVLFGYGLADQFIANVIQPSMQGRSLNMSTFMVMVSLTFWATLWGGIGAFLAVPMMVVTMVICAEIPGARWIAVLLSSDGHLQDDHPNEETETGATQRASSIGGSWVKGIKKTELDAEVEELRTELKTGKK